MRHSLAESVRAEKVCIEEIERLKTRALTDGDPSAVLTLAGIAHVAVDALHALWKEAGKGTTKEPELVMKEMLSYFLRPATTFPVLYGRAQRAPLPAHVQTVREIMAWPFKPRERAETRVKDLLEKQILPAFQRIQ